MMDAPPATMIFRLRPATAADQQAVKALVRAARINPMGLHWHNFVLAVDEAGQVVGCGQIKPHRDGSRELASIAVVEEWRGRGVARAIIEQLMAGAERPLWLTCTSGLVAMYERFGFREVGPAAPVTPYFHRLRRLARLLVRLARSKEYLAVMVWEEEK